MPFETCIPDSPEDRESWSTLWAIARSPFPSSTDVAKLLGVAAGTVRAWASGQDRGPWAGLRATFREAARKHRHKVPEMVRALVVELFDEEGTWIPKHAVQPVKTFQAEILDVYGVCSELVEAQRRGASRVEIAAILDRAHGQLLEAGIAAAAEAK